MSATTMVNRGAVNHGLVKLFAATIAVVGLAFWVNTARHPETLETTGNPLVPGMKAAINNITGFRVIGAGNQTLVSVNKNATGWAVAERDGYAADIDKVREFLIQLADATLIEPKTSNPDWYSKLGVSDVASTAALGVRLELDGLKSPVKTLIGTFNGQGGGGTFVRRNDEASSWLAKGSLVPEKSPSQWLQKNLADIPSSRVQRVEIHQAGQTLVAAKSLPMEANFQIEGVPKQRQLKSEFEGNALASVLSSLRLDDVRKAGADNLSEAVAPQSARYQTFDGLIINAVSRDQGEHHWVSFSATLDPVIAEANILREQQQAVKDFAAAEAAFASQPAATDKTAATASSSADQPASGSEATAPVAPLAVSDAAKDKLERMQKLQQEVSSLNARFRGWEYRLPPYTWSNMVRSMEELLAPPAAK